MLCQNCKRVDAPTPEEKILITTVLGSISDSPKKYALEELGDNTKGEKVWRAEGCEKCNDTGYKSRMGVHEGMVVDEAVEDLVTKNPSEREIKLAIEPQGILTLLEDGVVKALKGITSLDEITRIIG